MEEVIDPALPIVDAHHHLRQRGGKDYLLPELCRDLASGHTIVATVAIETGVMYDEETPLALRPVGETRFLAAAGAEAAQSNLSSARVCHGIVGFADLLLGNAVERTLEGHMMAGGARFRGIRVLAAWDEDPLMQARRVTIPPDLLQNAEFRTGFRVLERFGLSFETWIFHSQLDQFIDLANAFPDTTFILNHIGGPAGIGRYAGKRAEVFAVWSARMREAATRPNIYVKLGGMGMPNMGFGFEARTDAVASTELADAWRPYVETCIDAFGPGRCMFESNFPTDSNTCSYRTLWNAFKRLASGYSDTEKAALFSGTAIAAYRLPPLVTTDTGPAISHTNEA